MKADFPRVGKPRALKGRQRTSFGDGDQNLVFPVGRIPNVGVRRGDVEVARDHNLPVVGCCLSRPLGEGGEPIQLIKVFCRRDFLSVRNVNAGHGENDVALRREIRRNKTLLIIGVTGNAAGDAGNLCNALFDGHRDAVVGFLAVENDVVAGGLKKRSRESVVGGFRFLHDEHVDGGAFKPGDDLFGAHFDAVDVPSRNFHEPLTKD